MKSGRWDVYGKELFRLKDRHERDFCLGPTHEEVITVFSAREINSWRDLPKRCIKYKPRLGMKFGLD